MKRSFCIILLVLSLVLCACGEKTGEIPETEAAAPTPTFTPEPTATPVPTPSPSPAATPEPTDPNHKSRIPVLMYHQVAAPEENDLYLSPENFQSQLDWLERNGYTPITMRQLSQHWRLNIPVPDKPIVLTFDDGYLSMYTEVYPRLMEKGWAATFYIVPEYTGDGTTFITPDMIGEMAQNGMEIGSHTYHHLQLDELSEADQISELTKSRTALEAWSCQEVVSFCYPAGRYDDSGVRAVADTGYECAVTTALGIADESEGFYTIPRLRISWGMNGDDLGNMLSAQ